MARRRPSDDDGSFIAWLQANLASLNRIAEAHESRMEAHEVRMEAHEARMDEIQKVMRIMANGLVELRHEVRESRRQTRELVMELSRIDRRRAKDAAALARTLAKIDGRVRRLEPKKSTKKKRK